MKPLIAKMNELVETDNTNIIGTFGLATCSALILYDKNKTVLGHITIDFKPLIRDMVKHFEPGIIGAIIVPGEYTTLDNIQDVIAFLNNHHEFFKNDFNITIKNLPDFNSLESILEISPIIAILSVSGDKDVISTTLSFILPLP